MPTASGRVRLRVPVGGHELNQLRPSLARLEDVRGHHAQVRRHLVRFRQFVREADDHREDVLEIVRRLGRDPRHRIGALEREQHPVRLLQHGAGVVQVGRLEFQRDAVRHGRREVAFLRRPLAGRPRVLVADGPDHPSVAVDRRVEHGCDAERLEVAVGELSRAGIARCDLGRNGTALLERREIGREVRDLQRDAGGVFAGRPFVQVYAAQRLAVPRVKPDADAGHVQRLRGDLANRAENRIERLVGPRRESRQFEPGHVGRPSGLDGGRRDHIPMPRRDGKGAEMLNRW